MKKLDLYLYLARRDKQGVRIISKFISRPQNLTLVTDENIANLFIPSNYLNDIKQKIYESRMLWECWVETCDTFENFKVLLSKRGYSNIPISPRPEINTSFITLNNKLENKRFMIRKA